MFPFFLSLAVLKSDNIDTIKLKLPADPSAPFSTVQDERLIALFKLLLMGLFWRDSRFSEALADMFLRKNMRFDHSIFTDATSPISVQETRVAILE